MRGLDRDAHASAWDRAVRDAVAEHADLRHRARLPRRLPARGHEPLRRPRHDAARSRSPARRGSTGSASPRASPRRGCPASSRARSASSRRSTSTRKQSCGGVQIHVTDARTFRPVATYVALIALAHHASPSDFRFRTERYEFVDDIPAFDLLIGSAEARERILAGDDPRAIADAVSEVGDEERAVVAEARRALPLAAASSIAAA